MNAGAVTIGRTFAGRFRAGSLLKDGQGVMTFLGTDGADGHEVIIKAVPSRDGAPSARLRLEHEAAVLRDSHVAALPSILGAGEEDGITYLVMPFIEGATLRERLLGPALPVDEALVVASRVLGSLHAAHVLGVLHRDVKPANIIVNADGPVERAQLIDFGLARSEALDESLREIPAGTARYMSPEQAGLVQGGLDERSDLYSLGIVLFECIAGRAPFLEPTIGGVLRQHVAEPPPSLRGLAPSCPKVVEELVERLLRKDPRERYQSARAVLADVTRVAAALADGETEPVFALGSDDARQTLTEPAFVGRDHELRALGSVLEAAQRGDGGIVLLEADSGGGKSRLLDELARRALQQRCLVFRGGGLGASAQRPFQPLTGIIRDLPPLLAADPTRRSALIAELRDHAPALVVAFPALGAVFAPARAAALGPETFGEVRTVHAIAALFDALGSRERPAVILLDDAQWADESTLKLLVHWHTATNQDRRRYVKLVVAFRSEEVNAGHPLRGLDVPRIVLEALGPSEVRQLVQSMAGVVPEEAIRVVVQLSEGSPFMAAAVLRGMVEIGALVLGPTGWRVDPTTLADVRASRRAAALLVRRLALLPPGCQRLLGAGAVLGKEFDLDLAAKLVGQSSSETQASAYEARQRHIIWIRGDGARCAFVHDKLREALLGELEGEVRLALHAEAARQIELAGGDRVFEIAFHLDAAGDPGRALPYALAAASLARSQFALELAGEEYAIARRGEADTDGATRGRIAVGLGEVLMLRGRYERALLEFQRALSLADTDVARAELEGKLGELAFKRGDVVRASEHLARSLELLGRKIPEGRLALAAALAREIVIQAAHTFAPRLFVGRRSKAGAGNEFIAIRVYNRLAYAYWFQRGKVACAWAHLKELNLAEKYPPTPELAQAYSTHAPVMTMIPLFRRGIAYVERSLEIRRASGDLLGQGQSLNFFGVVLYAASQFEACIARCKEAVRLLERTGDRWEANTAHWNIALAQYRLGRLGEAAATAQKVHKAALELGDRQALGISLGVWSKASDGNVPIALLESALAHPSDDVHTFAELMQAAGVRLLAEGKPNEAEAMFLSAEERVEAKGLRQEYVAPVLMWLTTARRMNLQRLLGRAACSARDAAAAGRAARRTAQRATRLARSYRNNLPHALRERALLFAMRGALRRSKRDFSESLAVAEGQGARYERALTLKARGDVGTALGWPGAELDRLAGERDLGEMQAARDGAAAARSRPPPVETSVTLSLVHRFSELLDVGRRIASALSLEEIFSAVATGAIALLRVDRAFLVECGAESGECHVLHGAADDRSEALAFSRTMVRRAIERGRTVVFAEPAEASESGALARKDASDSTDPGDSVILSLARSALCTPIFEHGRATKCLYVSSQEVRALFRPDDERLAEFIATLAGAAMENARNFHEVRALSEALERRVAERTSELELSTRELERSNRDLATFAYVASHDLQEPLRMISSYVELLAKRYEGRLDAQADKFIRYTTEGAARMRLLIHDLLAYARLDAQGKSPEPADSEAQLATALSNLRVAVAECDAVVGHDPLPAVLVDRGQLTQLFQNLIANALKFRRPGVAPVVQVSARRIGEECVFSVVDNGIGIEPAYFDRVFGVFQRLHVREAYAGTGIGLSICKKVVERHGGRIWVESDGQTGTAFHFTLPACDGAPPPRLS